jgi:hypothetical protein
LRMVVRRSMSASLLRPPAAAATPSSSCLAS